MNAMPKIRVVIGCVHGCEAWNSAVIEPVGTFTACTMKVMPNSAMITVTTADSKYSRQTLFGGPCGLAGGSVLLFVTVTIE